MRKVIKASAGTGKTYSLSLEYLNILFTYQNVSFEEIAVITFTKKATAEIRERIIEHLSNIIKDDSLQNPLVVSLKKINPNIKTYRAKEIYEKLITNKDKFKITTIDSFINSIFRSIVAPMLNIIDYEIDPNINDKYLPILFNEILTSKHRMKFDLLFKNFKSKSLQSFEDFIKTVIEKRWIFDFSKNIEKIDYDTELFWENFIKHLSDAIQSYQEYLRITDIAIINPQNKKLNKAFWEFYQKQNEFTVDELESIILEKINELHLQDRLEFFDFEKFIPTIRSKKYIDFDLAIKYNISLAKQYYIDYLFLTDFMEEQAVITDLANFILEKYDAIKFQTKIFTYSDISYYTYKFLRDEEQKDNFLILNLFYEKLAYKIRFLLIDEFQDTGIIQWNIINPIIQEIISGSGQKDYGGTIIVGDEKQAIYGWRDGERELLINSHRFIPFANETTLDTSYRSKKVIVDFINDIFTDFDEKWFYRKMLYRKNGGYVNFNITNLKATNLSKYSYYEMILKKYLFPIINKTDLGETAIIARTNKELETIAMVLSSYNISYILETSSSLYNHPLIKAIVFLLRFINTSDFWSLSKFLRSDLILATPDYLLKIYSVFSSQSDADIEDFFEYNKSDEIISKIKEIYYKKSKLSKTIHLIYESFGAYKIFTSELDFKNFNRFVEIALDFENNNTEYTKDISGFLRYIQDTEKEHPQMQLSETNLIKLLTIHKSKGLGFKNVFFFSDILPKPHNTGNDLFAYYSFDSHYTTFNESYYTLNFNKLIKNTSITDLYRQNELKEFYEAINNYYVAMTRSKNNLFVCLYYSKKDNPLHLFNQQLENPAVKLFSRYVNKIFKDKDDDFLSYEIGDIELSKIEHKTVNNFHIDHNFFIVEESNNPKKEIENDQYFKFVVNPISLFGTIIHYYLSFIRFNFETERLLAKKHVLMHYGLMIKQDKLEELLEKTDQFIFDNPIYFDSNLWKNVYTEYPIFDDLGNEYRIDRMLINEKEILILDYKTGENYNKNQLITYSKIIGKIFPNKTIKTKYLEIKI